MELARRVDLTSEEGRAKLLEEARPLISRISAPALGLLVRKRLAEVAGVTLEELNSLYNIRDISRFARALPAAPPARGQSLYRRVLQCLLMDPELARDPELRVPADTGPESQCVAQLIEFVRQNTAPVSTALVVQRFVGSPFDRLLAEVEREVTPLGSEFDSGAELRGALAKLQEFHDRQAKKRERELLESKGLESLTSEERSRYLALLQSGPQISSGE
jgi:DNA primase